MTHDDAKSNFFPNLKTEPGSKFAEIEPAANHILVLDMAAGKPSGSSAQLSAIRFQCLLKPAAESTRRLGYL